MHIPDHLLHLFHAFGKAGIRFPETYPCEDCKNLRGFSWAGVKSLWCDLNEDGNLSMQAFENMVAALPKVTFPISTATERDVVTTTIKRYI